MTEKMPDCLSHAQVVRLKQISAQMKISVDALLMEGADKALDAYQHRTSKAVREQIEVDLLATLVNELNNNSDWAFYKGHVYKAVLEHRAGHRCAFIQLDDGTELLLRVEFL